MTVVKPDLGGLVSVYGKGVSKPLLQSKDVRLIQIRDADGELQAMFFRLTSVLWGFSARGDSDWEDHKGRLEIDDSNYLDEGAKGGSKPSEND